MSKRLTLNSNKSEDSGKSLQQEIEINFLEIIHLLVKRKKVILGVVLAVMVLAAAYSLTIDNYYRSTATILPSGKTDRMSELRNLAGLGGSGNTDENSSTMFPVILSSRHVRQAVLERPYQFFDNGEQKSMTLTEYFGNASSDLCLRGLSGMTYVTVDKVTGVISIAVESQYPELSRDVTKAYLEELEKFNRHTRKSRARDNARYLAGQIAQTRQELDSAQYRLETFRKQNSNWAMTTSPEILRRSSQLELDVEIKTKAFLFLSQEYEAVKQDVLNDVPVVRILDEPNLPVMKAGPGRTVMVLMAGIIAFIGIVSWIFGAAVLKRIIAGQDEEIFEEIKNDLKADLPLVNRLTGKRKELVES